MNNRNRMNGNINQSYDSSNKWNADSNEAKCYWDNSGNAVFWEKGSIIEAPKTTGAFHGLSFPEKSNPNLPAYEDIKNLTPEGRFHEINFGGREASAADVGTSIMQFDNGATVFTYGGYMGVAVHDAKGQMHIRRVEDIADAPEDFQPYEGYKIGETYKTSMGDLKVTGAIFFNTSGMYGGRSSMDGEGAVVSDKQLANFSRNVEKSIVNYWNNGGAIQSPAYRNNPKKS